MRGIERQSKMINKNRENHQIVWVVDDDQGILDVVKIIFEQECFPGKYFSDPKLMQAEISRGNRPSLLLLDVFMRGVNGVNIALNLKNQCQTKHIPIILLTADLDAAEKAKQAKVEGFLTKPFDIAELLAVVKKYVVIDHPGHDLHPNP